MAITRTAVVNPDGVAVAQGNKVSLRGVHIAYGTANAGLAGNATAGDVVVLRDGGPTGTVRYLFVISGTNGTLSPPICKDGVLFGDGIYVSEQAAAENRISVTVEYSSD